MRFFCIRIVLIFVYLLFSHLGFGQASKANRQNRIKTSLKNQVENLQKQATQLLDQEDSINEAVLLLSEAYSISSIAGYSKGLMSSSYHLGRGFLAKSENTSATRYFYISLKEAEFINDSSGLSQAYMGLGLVMYNMNKWSDAIDNFDKSQQFYVNKSSSSLAPYLSGLSYYRLMNYSRSKAKFFEAKVIAEQNRDSSRLLEIRLYLNDIASLEIVGDFILSEYDFLYSQFKRRSEKVGMCYALNGRSNYLLKLGDTKGALIEADRAMILARNIEMITPLKLVLNTLVRIEYRIGNYKSSVDHLMELEELKDSLMREGAASRIALLSAGHEFEKKEAIYDGELKDKNRQKWAMIIAILALGVIVFSVAKSRRSIAKERKRSDDLLANILPEETALELKRDGVASAKAHEEVTIVFSDIKNFTGIAGTLKPEVLVKLLGRYFGEFDAAITSYGLEKIKTIGDAYMFVGGLNGGAQENAIHAIDASKRMLSTVESLRDEMIYEYGVSFEFRLGMHTGPVVSGVVGTVKYAFDIWGDAVNIAARMEQHSESGKVNISEATYQLVKNHYECESRGKIDVKNGGERGMYFVNNKIKKT
jgi:class 3 adenylate cyclase